VDDFAFRKRKSYGTAILDAETGKYAAFINSREHDDIVACLKRFTNVQTVSRDGFGTYKKAFDEAIPEAVQISDRFHLVKNLIDAVERSLTNIIPFCIVPKRPKENLLGVCGKMTSIEKQRLETYKNRLKVFKRVKALQVKGKNAATVSRELGLSDGMVRKYFALESLPLHGAVMRERESMLNPYKQKIIDMIRARCRLVEIVKVLRQAGCKSADSRIRGFASKVKRDGVDYTEERFYRRDVCRLLYAPAEKIRDERLRDKVEKYVAANPHIVILINLVNEFRQILKGKNAAALDDWNLMVKALKNRRLSNFVKYIESDLTAIKNAILYPYSNGVAEGKINKLKTIKRQIYGRASYELLTSRLF
jgi:transposase